ncbi:unnamed protein product [Symbiodinium natans]|uniref:FAD-binding domain-containing protein n=1 Tax=Symbiodinium natans TaxID=878477 RepID=A0A812Q176_9DINO|nr:unnamed protein product [Symbiodinium natans]
MAALSPAFASPGPSVTARPVTVSPESAGHWAGRPNARRPCAGQAAGAAGAVTAGALLGALAAGTRHVGRFGRSKRVKTAKSAKTVRAASVVAEVGTQAGEKPAEGKKLKVIIAGGGVGGLTCAVAMLKKGWDVRVYEKTGKFARFGGPIQFASNATSTLKAIDERLFDRVMQKFTFTATRRCGIKDGLRSNGDFRMTDVLNPSYFVDKDVPADWFISFPLKECADVFNLPYTGVINRPDLQDILLDECKDIKEDFIVNGVSVKSYDNHDNGVTVHLSDGTTEEADILVGADGIWSAVRAEMYKEGAIKAPSKDGKSIQGCRYSGYTVFAGETVLEVPDYYECGYKVYIGPQRYFVTSDVGEGRIQWYAFLALPPGTRKAGDTWSGESGDAKEGADVISYLKSLHEGWSEEVFYVLDNTPAESVEQRDLYDRWPEFFRSWADGNVVLMGDAVHPMMPNLGQGGCQAIEDAYELVRILDGAKTYSQDYDPKVTADALQRFYRNRMPRVAGISLLSGLASDLIINAFGTPWSPHDEKGTDWRSYLTVAWKPLLQFVFFPLQFLFLYSNHPSGGMGDLPKQLVDDWEKRHREAAEEHRHRPKIYGTMHTMVITDAICIFWTSGLRSQKSRTNIKQWAFLLCQSEPGFNIPTPELAVFVTALHALHGYIVTLLSRIRDPVPCMFIPGVMLGYFGGRVGSAVGKHGKGWLQRQYDEFVSQAGPAAAGWRFLESSIVAAGDRVFAQDDGQKLRCFFLMEAGWATRLTGRAGKYGVDLLLLKLGRIASSRAAATSVSSYQQPVLFQQEANRNSVLPETELRLPPVASNVLRFLGSILGGFASSDATHVNTLKASHNKHTMNQLNQCPCWHVQCVPFGCCVADFLLEFGRKRACNGRDVIVVSNSSEVVESCQTVPNLRQLSYMFVDGELVMPGLRSCTSSTSSRTSSTQELRRGAHQLADRTGRKRSRSPRRVDASGRAAGDVAETSDTLRDSQLDGELLEEQLGELGDTQIDGLQGFSDARPSALATGGLVTKLAVPLDMAFCYADTQVVEDISELEPLEQPKPAADHGAGPLPVSAAAPQGEVSKQPGRKLEKVLAATVPEPSSQANNSQNENGSRRSCSFAEDAAQSQDSQASRVSWGGSDAEEPGRCTEALLDPAKGEVSDVSQQSRHRKS